ncbi:hypothetical protein ACP70R_028396 [Stipagrostis hirtigluma subsp. patula]
MSASPPSGSLVNPSPSVAGIGQVRRQRMGVDPSLPSPGYPAAAADHGLALHGRSRAAFFSPILMATESQHRHLVPQARRLRVLPVAAPFFPKPDGRKILLPPSSASPAATFFSRVRMLLMATSPPPSNFA